jgi:hypothetical protein
MSTEKEKELKASLNKLLDDLIAQKKTMNDVVAKVGIGKPFDIPDLAIIWRAIKTLESIKSIPIDNLLFAKKLIEIEKLFKNSSTLKNHTLPNFRDMIPKETLIYADIDREIDKLENKSKNLLDRGYRTASESVEDIVDSLREFNILLFEDKSISYEKYKNESIHLIRTKAFGLDEHRGCKEILVNLALLISTLGVAHIVRYMNHGYLLFTAPTDTSNKIDNLEKIIKNSEMHFPSTSTMKV